MFDRIRKILFPVIGIISLIYYIVCIAYAHAGVSWLWLWPLLAIFCFVRFIMLLKNIHLPKVLRIIYYSAICLFLGIFVIAESNVVSAMSSAPQQGLDYIIVLGAAVRNGEPTTPLRLRIKTAGEYMQSNPNTIAVTSGGQGETESMSEAQCIKRHLVADYGIDESRIILEEKSSDTEENIKFSFELIPPGSSVGVVTNSFHICRALRIAELQGYELSPVPAETYMPLGIHYTVREAFAMIQLEAENFAKS